ncbi:hypothetical protein ISU02_23065 [Fusibacter sp. Q10-2]|uniref:Uncharacterized protein n=2 Tax=Fusibacter ferrireducens TaxID=2785058 RepID=A0ABR9ZZX5_9FIRM|nr:hypothetical protein [Fusibacter ferrireducens]
MDLIIIRLDQRVDYYDVLDLAHITMNYGPLMKFVSDLVVELEGGGLSVLD